MPAKVRRRLAAPKLLTLLTILVTGAAQARAQSQPAPQQSQVPPQLTLTQQIARTVAFISVPYVEGDPSTPKYVTGTCFFVAVPDERLGKNQVFFYTVTNRHVATAEGIPQDELLPQVDIFFNRSQPENGNTVTDFRVRLTATVHWYFPSDASIDLAVLPIVPPTNSADMNMIPTALLATDQEIRAHSIGVGDSVFFIGYFLQFPVSSRVEPIYRGGVIAMMPSDPIAMSDGRDHKTTLEHLYLADAHAFHGNSGSPLFVNTSGFRNGTFLASNALPDLLGVVNGFIPERSDIQVTGAATFESSNEPNSGILTFVPAQELYDLLYGPALQKMRDDSVASSKKQ